MTKKLIALGLFLLVACNSQMEYMNNSDKKILNAAIEEARVRGLLEKDSYLLTKPLIDHRIFKNRSQFPEQMGGIPIKSNEWIFERNITSGCITLDQIKSENGVHEIQFSYLNSNKEGITIQIKLGQDLKFLGYTNATKHEDCTVPNSIGSMSQS